jgi:hypothetical protein
MFNKEARTMKSIKGLFFILFALACVFCVGQAAFALIGSQAGESGGGIIVSPKAHGTRYEGPLTIYYTNPVQEYIEGVLFTFVDMNFFLRLENKSTLNAFSGKSLHVDYLNIPIQQEAITVFIQNTVIPILYPEYDPKPDFLLKSVDLKVEDDGGSGTCCNGMYFTIMDVVIAVQD